MSDDKPEVPQNPYLTQRNAYACSYAPDGDVQYLDSTYEDDGGAYALLIAKWKAESVAKSNVRVCEKCSKTTSVPTLQPLDSPCPECGEQLSRFPPFAK